jgi:hypothetical protein
LGRRVELLLVPVLLDLVLWLAPRFSISPLLGRLADFYTSMTAGQELPPEAAEMSLNFAQLLEELGRRYNLLDMLVSSSLLHVPSLLAAIGPISTGEQVLDVGSVVSALGLSLGFGIVGILVGVIYMNLLAGTLPLGASKPVTLPDFARTVVRHWLLVLLYVGALFAILAAGLVPITAGIALLGMLSPALSFMAGWLLAGVVMVLFFYLYFVTAALILDNLPLHTAVAQSFVLVRNNFWAVLGFIILTNLITVGIAMLLAQLTSFEPIGPLAAIAINAYIGTGLTLALLVFYRTRLLKMTGDTHELEKLG